MRITRRRLGRRSAGRLAAVPVFRFLSRRAGSRPRTRSGGLRSSRRHFVRCRLVWLKASMCGAISTGRCWTTSSGHSATRRRSAWSRLTGGRLPGIRNRARRGWGRWRGVGLSRIELSLRCLRDRADQGRVDLRLSVESQKAVALLLDVRQLRVAEALDGARRHQRLDHLSIGLEQLGRVLRLRPAKATFAGQRDAAELAADDGLAEVRVAGQYDGARPRWRIKALRWAGMAWGEVCCGSGVW